MRENNVLLRNIRIIPHTERYEIGGSMDIKRNDGQPNIVGVLTSFGPFQNAIIVGQYDQKVGKITSTEIFHPTSVAGEAHIEIDNRDECLYLEVTQ